MRHKNYYLIFATVFFLALFALSINNEKEIEDREPSLNENLEIQLPDEITDPDEITLEKPKTSWAGTMNNITIDDTGGTVGAYTWDQAKDEVWCDIKNDVYIIENVIINASKSPTSSGILIKNSNFKNFIIRNCTIYDAATGGYPDTVNGCIKLINSSRGQIYSNNLTSTTGAERYNAGLALYQCKNITVINNTIEGSGNGLFMRFTNESLIFNNSMDSSYNVGIFLSRECQYNNITGNQASYTSAWYGICLYDNSSYNRIVNNTANNNALSGIRLGPDAVAGFGCDYNTILNNTANDNGLHGMDIRDYSDNNNIINNTANNNAQIGISLTVNCDFNDIIENTANNNSVSGIALLGTCDNNTIDNNVANNNKIWGIYFLNANNDNNITNNNVCNYGIFNQINQTAGIYFQGASNYNNIINNIANGNNGTGIKLYYSDNNNLINNTANNNIGAGIQLSPDCDSNTIINNTANGNTRQGMYINFNSNDNDIINNTVNNNGDGVSSYRGGIFIQTCEDNTLINNTINYNDNYGIYLFVSCNRTEIRGNTIYDNINRGIIIYANSNDNLVSRNIINDHDQYGIHVSNNCDDNNITGNIITDNLIYGLFIQQSTIDNTIIVGNNFTGNGASILNIGTNTIEAMNCIDGVCTPLIIDANGGTTGAFTWEEVIMHVPWFKGSGISTDPYIIENIKIKGRSTTALGALYIKDSLAYFTIRNCEISNGSYGWKAGLALAGLQNANIVNNNISNNQWEAIYVTYSSNVRIHNNTLYNNPHAGIRAGYAQNINITSNDIRYAGVGIELRGNSDYFYIANNTIRDTSGYGIFIWGVNGNSDHNTIFNNSICFNTGIGIYLVQDCYWNVIENNTVRNNDGYGIELIANCSYNTITGNIVEYNGDSGIYITEDCNNNEIIGNTANNNYENGLYLFTNCHNNTIANNTFNENGDASLEVGIRLDTNCDDNNIDNNTIIDNWHRGIMVNLYCDNNNITNNLILNTPSGTCDVGIRLDNYCNNNNIINNTANGHDFFGISLAVDCDGNTILNNTCNNNVGDGIRIEINCDNNNITGNMINDNGVGVSIATSNCINNVVVGNILNGNGISDSGSATKKGMNLIDGVCTPLTIDDNGGTTGALTWAEAILHVQWFKGSGTSSDPYIIEDIEIDASTGNGLLIIDSNTVYFIIRNCVIYDSMAGSYPDNIYGCIKLEDSSEGQIYSNNLSQTSSDDITNGGLVLYDCTNIIIINNTFDGTKYGILMRYSNENLIYNNTVNYQQHVGIFLNRECHYNNITFNNISYNGIHGIALYDNCTNNRVENNIANSNAQMGIILTKQDTSYGSSYNFIANNSANDNGKGILLTDFSKYNTIADNNCSFNTYLGIELYNNCYRNTISNNRMEGNNDYGIAININSYDNNCTGNFIINNDDYGVYMSDSNSDNNWFFNNHFEGNGAHVYDLDTNTKWNNSEIGNYWDDYVGVDADDNGIGDSSYEVHSNVYDELPIWWDAPVVSITSPAYLDLFGNATVNFTISVTNTDVNLGSVHMWYLLINATNSADKRSNQTFQYTTYYILFNLWNTFENGYINIWFFVNDSRGYISSANVTVEKDVDIPTISIVKMGFYGVGGASAINFTVALDGPGVDTFWYRILNGSQWTDNFTFTAVIGQFNRKIDTTVWASLLNGTYIIQFYLNDTTPGAITAKINGTFIKDTVAPSVLISSPSNYNVFGFSPPDIKFNINEGNLHRIWYSLNDGTLYGNFTYRDDIADEVDKILFEYWDKLDNGTVIIQFWANDTGGNVDYTIVTLTLLKDIINPTITSITRIIEGFPYGSTPPLYTLNIDDPNFNHSWYTLFDGTNYLTSSIFYGVSNFFPIIYIRASIPKTAATEYDGSIDQNLWNQLNNGQINITFYVTDKAGNIGYENIMVIKEVSAAVGIPLPSAGDDDDDDGDEDTMEWVVRALLAGLISGSVGISLRIAYSKIKKKREAAREAAAPTVVLKKKYQIVHHDFLTPYKKVEQKEFRVGIAQVGLSKKGNLITELYEMTSGGLMRIREDMLETVSANIKSMIEQAHENKINILLFPEMTFDLNYKSMVKDVKQWAQDYNMYIITGGYHDIKTKQNICAVFGPEGIFWEQVKHTPATIHFGKTVFTEAIEVHRPPHKLHICSTEYGRIAIAICRDFLDMDLRVEVKNCEPPVDLFFNPAYTPVTADFKATHFDARRAVYAYTFFANVGEYGGTSINTPEKDRTKRRIPPKEEGLIFKDVDLFSLRSERKKWERRQSKEKRYIQSTRS